MDFMMEKIQDGAIKILDERGIVIAYVPRSQFQSEIAHLFIASPLLLDACKEVLSSPANYLSKLEANHSEIEEINLAWSKARNAVAVAQKGQIECPQT